MRKQQSDDSEALKTEQESLPELESRAREGAQALLEAELVTIRAKEELNRAAPLIAKVRSLDQRLADRRNALSDLDEECRQDGGSLEKARESRDEKSELLAGEADRLKIAERWLEEHRQDEWLAGGLAGVEEQVNALVFRQKDMADGETAWRGRRTPFGRRKRNSKSAGSVPVPAEGTLEAVSEELRREQEALAHLLDGRLLREYRAEKEALLREMAFLARMPSWRTTGRDSRTARRAPLCGSLEHPLRRGTFLCPTRRRGRSPSLKNSSGGGGAGSRRAEAGESRGGSPSAGDGRGKGRRGGPFSQNGGGKGIGSLS